MASLTIQPEFDFFLKFLQIGYLEFIRNLFKFGKILAKTDTSSNHKAILTEKKRRFNYFDRIFSNSWNYTIITAVENNWIQIKMIKMMLLKHL